MTLGKLENKRFIDSWLDSTVATTRSPLRYSSSTAAPSHVPCAYDSVLLQEVRCFTHSHSHAHSHAQSPPPTAPTTKFEEHHTRLPQQRKRKREALADLDLQAACRPRPRTQHMDNRGGETGSDNVFCLDNQCTPRAAWPHATASSEVHHHHGGLGHVHAHAPAPTMDMDRTSRGLVRSGSPQKRQRRTLSDNGNDDDCDSEGVLREGGSTGPAAWEDWAVERTRTAPSYSHAVPAPFAPALVSHGLQYPTNRSTAPGSASSASEVSSVHNAKSKRSSSPSKTSLSALQRQQKPISFLAANTLPLDVTALMTSVVSDPFIPSTILDDVRTAAGNFDPIRNDMRGDDMLSRQVPELHNELAFVQDMRDRTNVLDSEGLCEPAWGEDVIRPILRHVFERRNAPRASLRPYNVTTVKLLPRLSPDGEALPNKVVDYVLTSTHFTDTKSIKSILARQSRGKGSNGSSEYINHFTYQATWDKPAVISIEVKTEQNSQTDAKIQLAVWAAAQFHKLRQLTGQPDSEPISLTLPLIIIYGAVWKLSFAVDMPHQINILKAPHELGSTDTISGCYKLMANLRRLSHWADDVFYPWFVDHVMGGVME